MIQHNNVILSAWDGLINVAYALVFDIRILYISSGLLLMACLINYCFHYPMDQSFIVIVDVVVLLLLLALFVSTALFPRSFRMPNLNFPEVICHDIASNLLVHYLLSAIFGFINPSLVYWLTLNKDKFLPTCIFEDLSTVTDPRDLSTVADPGHFSRRTSGRHLH